MSESDTTNAIVGVQTHTQSETETSPGQSQWDDLESALESDLQLPSISATQSQKGLTISHVRQCNQAFSQDKLVPASFRAKLESFSDEDLFGELQWLDGCLVNKRFFTVKSREIAWSNYHKALLQKQSSLSRPLLATISRAALQLLLDENFHVPESIPPAEPEPVCDSDKDIVQYIAGFVVYRIRKFTRRLNDSNYRSQKLEMVSVMINTGPCSSVLVNTKQRGGLLSIDDELIPVFTKMEYIIRVHTRSSQTSMDAIMHIVCNDDKLCKLLTKFFSDRVPSASQDMVDELYFEMVKTYVTTRINGYCRQLMENLRKETQSHKAQKALRKSLKESRGVAEAED